MMGANYTVLRSILRVKLIMDERRVPTVLNDIDGKEGNYYLKSLLIYGIMGLMLLIFFLPPFPLFFKMNMVYGLILFMLVSSLISDFSSVLLDVNEKNILMPKPIDKKTFALAKAVHILLYLSILSAVLGGAVLIAGTFIYGVLFPVIYIIQLFFLLGFAIFLTSMLYFLVLKFFDGERLKDIINYFQIGFTIVLAISYQFIGRAFTFIDLNVAYTPKWWSFLIPPAWFSAPYALLIEGDFNFIYFYLTLIGIIVSVILLFVYLKKIAPYFETNLSKMNNSSQVFNIEKVEKKIRLWKKIAGLVSRNKEERAFYHFTKEMIAKERQLKLSLLPALAFGVIFPLIFIFNSYSMHENFRAFRENLTTGTTYLWIYMSISMFASSLPILSTSEKYKGAWIYAALPITSKSNILKGALKALLFNYFLPSFLIVSGIFIYLVGVNIIPHLVVMALAMILIVIVSSKMIKLDLPFSQGFRSIKDKSVATFLNAVGFSAVGAMAHFIVSRHPFGLYVMMIALTIAVPIAWNKLVR